MIDRYKYLEDMYRRTHHENASFGDLADMHLPRTGQSWRSNVRRPRKERVHHSRTENGTGSEALLLTLGLLSGLSALAVAAYHLAF